MFIFKNIPLEKKIINVFLQKTKIGPLTLTTFFCFFHYLILCYDTMGHIHFRAPDDRETTAPWRSSAHSYEEKSSISQHLAPAHQTTGNGV